MNSTDLLAATLTGVGALGVVTCGWLGVRAFSLARLVASVPPTPLDALDPGLHEVTGTLRAAHDVVAPMSGRACAWARLLLEQRRGGRWQTLLDHVQGGAGASLESSGTRAAVDLRTAEVVVSSTQRARAGVLPVPSEDLSALLERLGEVRLEAPPAGPFLRWREEMLLDGDTVYVVGSARREEESGAWNLVADGGPLVVTDRDEGEVIRYQRRIGRQWTLGGLGSLAVLAAGLWWVLGNPSEDAEPNRGSTTAPPPGGTSPQQPNGGGGVPSSTGPSSSPFPQNPGPAAGGSPTTLAPLPATGVAPGPGAAAGTPSSPPAPTTSKSPKAP